MKNKKSLINDSGVVEKIHYGRILVIVFCYSLSIALIVLGILSIVY